MDFLKLNYNCEKCGNSFVSFGFPESTYGEFLARTIKGDVRYVNMLEDITCKEVKKIFDKYIDPKKLSLSKLIQIFQSVFALSFDLSPDGDPFIIEGYPPCPQCGSIQMSSWGEKLPLEACSAEVEPINHENWNKLTAKQKEFIVKTELAKYINVEKKSNLLIQLFNKSKKVFLSS